MSVTNKIRAGLAFCLLIVGVVSGVSYWSIRQIPETTRMVEHTLRVIQEVKDAALQLNDLESAQRSYIISHQREYLDQFRQSTKRLDDRLGTLKELTSDNPSQQKRLNEFQGILAQRVAAAQDGITLRDREGLTAAVESVKTGLGRQLGERLRTILRDMERAEASLLASRHERQQYSAQRVTLVTTYGTLAAVLFVCMASFLITRYLTSPVIRLVEATKQLGGGALGYRVPIDSRDEFGLVAKAFNRMADRLERAQTEVLRQTGILQLILTSIADGVVVADTAGQFTFFNPAAERILGRGPTESGMPGWSEYYGIFRPDKKTPFPSEDLPLARAIRGESADNIEMFVRNRTFPEGVWLSVTGRPLYGEDRTLKGGVVVFNDTTVRRQAQEALERERNLLRTLIDHLPESIFVKDRQGRYLQANAALVRALGAASLEEVVGRDDFALYPRERAAQLTEGDATVLQSGESRINQEEPVCDESGASRWIATTRVPLRDARETVTGMVGISHDVTDRKLDEERINRLNESLRQRATELETVNRELEAFSYSVSHDLRAPLRHIDGFAELLVKKAGPVLDERCRRYVETISQSAKELGQLIDDLLVFSRMGRTEMNSARFPLEQLAWQVVRELEQETKGRKVSWRIEPLPAVEGDSAMLRLVLVNLFSNALKYTRTREHATIEVGSGNGSPGEVVVYVRDNGVGFDMRYVDKLFGVFQRLHSTKEFEGTGIGLANVRRIIHRHGGKTWAEGAVDAGAAFYFSLPDQVERTRWLS